MTNSARKNLGIRDCKGNEVRLILSGVLVVIESGEVALFRNRHAGVEWARASGFFLPDGWLRPEDLPGASRPGRLIFFWDK